MSRYTSMTAVASEFVFSSDVSPTPMSTTQHRGDVVVSPPARSHASDGTGGASLDARLPLATPPAISRRELEELHVERAELNRLQFARELTKREETRLRYLDWQIDRVEMAELGPQLAKLEGVTEVHRRALESIEQLRTAIGRR